jgi:hypothetical protein
MNAGDPAVRDLLVMAGDPIVDGLTTVCPSCQQTLGGILIDIRDGTIAGGRYFRVGEFDPSAFDHYTISADGSIEAHSDLLNQPFAEPASR